MGQVKCKGFGFLKYAIGKLEGGRDDRTKVPNLQHALLPVPRVRTRASRSLPAAAPTPPLPIFTTGAGAVSTATPLPAVMAMMPVIPVTTVAPLVLIMGPTPTSTPTLTLFPAPTPGKPSLYLPPAEQVISHECGCPLGDKNMASSHSNFLSLKLKVLDLPKPQGPTTRLEGMRP